MFVLQKKEDFLTAEGRLGAEFRREETHEGRLAPVYLVGGPAISRVQGKLNLAATKRAIWERASQGRDWIIPLQW